MKDKKVKRPGVERMIFHHYHHFPSPVKFMEFVARFYRGDGDSVSVTRRWNLNLPFKDVFVFSMVGVPPPTPLRRIFGYRTV